MERTASLAFFAERYHWTAAQTMAENPAWYIDRLPALAEILAEIQDEKARKS